MPRKGKNLPHILGARENDYVHSAEVFGSAPERPDHVVVARRPGGYHIGREGYDISRRAAMCELNRLKMIHAGAARIRKLHNTRLPRGRPGVLDLPANIETFLDVEPGAVPERLGEHLAVQLRPRGPRRRDRNGHSRRSRCGWWNG